MDKDLNKNSKRKAILIEVATVCWAAFFNALGLSAIMIPNGLTYGGIAGLARLVQNVVGISYSLMYYFFAMAVVVLVWVTLGFKEVRKIIAMSFVLPAVMALFERYNVAIIIGEDKLMAALLFGAVIGIANGGMFLGGYSSGGTDSIAKVIKAKIFPYIGISKLTFMLDCMIIIISAFAMGINVALYAMVSIYAAMKLAETVMYGFTMKLIELSIITSIPSEVSEYIMHEIVRGVTSIDTVGEYTGEHKKQLKVICSPREGFQIKRYLAEHDPQAFVSVSNISAVWGNGKGFTDMNDTEM